MCGLGSEESGFILNFCVFYESRNATIAVDRLEHKEPHEDKKQEAAPMCAASAVLGVRLFPANVIKCSAAANVVVFAANCSAY